MSESEQSRASGRPRWRDRWMRWVVAGLAPLGIGGSITALATLETASPLPRWVAIAVLFVSLWGARKLGEPLVDRGRALSDRWRSRLEKRPAIGRAARGLARAAASGWPYVVVVVGVAWAMWPLPRGVMPIGQDHAYHYLQTRVLVDEMLANGRVFGWSDRFAGGLPFGDAYGTGVYFVTAFAHLLSFGTVPLRASYGVGIFLAWLVGSLAVAAWAIRLTPTARTDTGPRTGRRGRSWWVAPVVAGVLYALDPGGDRQGGWVYSMFHGVWPQWCATGLWAWALLSLVRLAERPTTVRLGIAVLSAGAALWAHPMNIINGLVAAPLFVIAYVFVRPRTSADLGSGQTEPAVGASDPRRGALWITIACGLAAVIGLGWFSRLLYAADHELIEQYTTYWGSLRELMLGVLRGELFDNQLPWVSVGAVVGGAIAIKRARPLDVAVVSVLVAMLVVGSMEPLLAFDFGLHTRHKALMYTRFAISMKPFWYALAGCGCAAVVELVRNVPRPVRHWGNATRVVLLVALAPVAWGASQALPSVPPTPSARPLTAESARISEDLNAIQRVLEKERRRLGPNRPHRIAFWEQSGDQGSYGLIPLADAGFGHLGTRSMPTHAYKYLRKVNARRNSETLRFLGASLLLTRHERDYDGSKKLGRFGRHYVYRLQDDPSWPARVEGEGSVEVLSWTPHRRRLRVSGTGPDSRLVLGFSPYPKWHASQGGRQLELEPYRETRGYIFSQVGGIRDGEVVVRYEDSRTEQAWLIAAAIVGIAALLGIAAWWVPLPPLLPARALPSVPGAALLVLLTGVGLGYAQMRSYQSEAVRRAWLKHHPNHELLSILHQRMPDSVQRNPPYRCVHAYTRNYDTDCYEARVDPELHPGPRRRHGWPPGHRADKPAIEIPSCMRFGVPTRGRTLLTYRLPPGTTKVVGRLYRTNHERARGHIQIGSQRTEVRSNGHRFEVAVPEDAERFMLQLTAPNPGSALPCLELLALGKRPE